MHGLINRSIQEFVCDLYGVDAWLRATQLSAGGTAEFEALGSYPDAETDDLLQAVGEVLDKPRDRLLEDVGTWLVTAARAAPVRRLLRYGGPDYVEFLHSLDELPDRARLAVAGLDLPELELSEVAPRVFTLAIGPVLPGFGHALVGVLRAMADDYGALAVIEHAAGPRGDEAVHICLVAPDYAEGRSFSLAARPA